MEINRISKLGWYLIVVWWPDPVSYTSPVSYPPQLVTDTYLIIVVFSMTTFLLDYVNFLLFLSSLVTTFPIYSPSSYHLLSVIWRYTQRVSYTNTLNHLLSYLLIVFSSYLTTTSWGLYCLIELLTIHWHPTEII